MCPYSDAAEQSERKNAPIKFFNQKPRGSKNQKNTGFQPLRLHDLQIDLVLRGTLLHITLAQYYFTATLTQIHHAQTQ